MSGMKAYVELCFMANRQTDASEYLDWTMFKIEPDWYKEMIA